MIQHRMEDVREGTIVPAYLQGKVIDLAMLLALNSKASATLWMWTPVKVDFADLTDDETC